ncbi:MAG TPA: class I SAM-dependent methyltransferase [Phycisphaerales bacterium]|nr:class I SAM-dependent methyltransferase [Phycisphaerales bacterium]
MTSDYWNERYSGTELAYGEAPNDFIVQVGDRLPGRGRALDLAAGEGRNALFLASLGLDVLAVDQSAVGMQKAERRARERGLTLRTQTADLLHFGAEPGSFDVITSIFVHLPAAVRRTVHERVRSWLGPNGVYVLKAYAPDQIGRGTGGPRDPSRLASLDEIAAELDGLAIEHQAALVRNVSEGVYHTGQASVVQVFARKC